MPHYTEKTGGLLCHQTLAPNLLERCIPTGEQVNGVQYSHSYPWDKPTEPAGETDPCTSKRNLNTKQGTEKEHATEGTGCSECTREVGRSKELISM
jgi:hypothetical protein